MAQLVADQGISTGVRGAVVETLGGADGESRGDAIGTDDPASDDPVRKEYARRAARYDLRWTAYVGASVGETLKRLDLRSGAAAGVWSVPRVISLAGCSAYPDDAKWTATKRRHRYVSTDKAETLMPQP